MQRKSTVKATSKTRILVLNLSSRLRSVKRLGEYTESLSTHAGRGKAGASLRDCTQLGQVACAGHRRGPGLLDYQIRPDFAAELGSSVQVGVHPIGQQGGRLRRAQDGGTDDGRLEAGAGHVVKRERQKDRSGRAGAPPWAPGRRQ